MALYKCPVYVVLLSINENKNTLKTSEKSDFTDLLLETLVLFNYSWR